MKLFLLRILTYSSLWVMAIGLSYYSNIPTPSWMKSNEGVNVMNTGNSHGNSIVYSGHSNSGINLARPANTIYYDLQHYKLAKGKLNKNGTVLIVISYLSFGIDENRIDLGDSFIYYFYHYMPLKSIYNYSLIKHATVVAKQASENLKAILTNGEPVIVGQTAKPLLVERTIDEKLQYLDYHGNVRSIGHKKIGEAREASLNLSYLEELIEDSKDSGFCPIIVTPPYYKSYNQKFNSNWLDSYFYKSINKLLNKYGIHHLDFSKDINFVNSPEFFKNSDHLNDIGKEKFSKILFDEINSSRKIYCDF